MFVWFQYMIYDFLHGNIFADSENQSLNVILIVGKILTKNLIKL